MPNRFVPPISKRSNSLRTLLMAALVLMSQQARAQENVTLCGSLENAYGPYDFRTDRDKLPIVIGAHFTPVVEQLIRGTTSRTPGGDIDYTLRAIPNHPNALVAIARLAEREQKDPPIGSRYTVDCWFDRAIRFRPDDQVVRMLFANYLTEKKRPDQALSQLEYVRLTLLKDNPITHYNLGLLYFNLQQFDRALALAHQALAMGYPRHDLQHKLSSVGHWRDPVSASTQAAPAPLPPDEQAKR